MIGIDDEDVDALREYETGDRRQKTNTNVFYAELGDVVNNDIKFFGNMRTKNKRRVADFICPGCNEKWTCIITSITSGVTKSCGCGRVKNKT